jgi:hypothetical protein
MKKHDPEKGYWRCPIHGTGLKCCEKAKWIEEGSG